ncbi:MAG: type IV-A pilus assembly ATPase PilB [Bdellovibrionia bacterium]
MSKQLAEVLVKDKVLTPEQMAKATAAVGDGKNGNEYIKFFIDNKFVSETKLLFYLSQKFGLPNVNLLKFEIPADVIKIISGELARKFQVIPLQVNKGTLVVAMWDPTQLAGLDHIRLLSKMSVEVVLTSFSAFETTLSKHYAYSAVGSAIESFKKESSPAGQEGGGGLIELVQVHDIGGDSAEQDAPVIQLVNGILSEGIKRMASDIHVEPYEKRFRVRMRVDGVLVEITEIPAQMKRAVIARFKIMSRMDIAETRVPQDGRIKLKLGGMEVDFRVNSMPTLFGEKVVLRMLSKGNLQLDLMKLGFEPKQLEVFKKGISSPNGLVLVTGPTGSGKTTTLYSALAELNQVSDNLSTAEDPVEYNLEGINQVQVQKEIGLTFASVLRALLRQDPDTILVGEIRDYETAEGAVQAALTGHLVLSTLHTNDAPSTITRLMNMGLEPFLVVASLNTVVGQRLLRVICAACKQEEKIPPHELIKVGFTEAEIQTQKFFKSKGCQKCNGTGYKGRVAIYEVLDFSPALKEMVLRGETLIELKKQAVKEGMKTLRMSALTKVKEGRTTLEEALSLTMES